MNRGQIVRWDFVNGNNNRGTIVGCFDDVNGQTFSFSIRAVEDDGLETFLKANPHINRTPDCSEGPNTFWVFFNPVGSRARNISRIFP